MKTLSIRYLAIFALTVLYGLTFVIAVLLKPLIPRKKKRYNRIIINGTFHNPNWFFAHIEPLTRSNYGEILLITDAAIADLPNLRTICPPHWAMTVFTRAGAKALWTFATGIKYPADCFMGYHIFPSAITALLCARLTGAKAAYQVTSGPLELEGGGWNAENKLLTSLAAPSAIVERLALAITKCFDLVVVRGSRASQYIKQCGFQNTLEIVTGSVVTNAELMQSVRDIDILFVGRLTEYKRPDRFLEVVKRVVDKLPHCRIAIVGDGPDRALLEDFTKSNNIAANVTFMGQRKDVPELQGRSKIYVLTSRWEGVSIAMLEAMGLANVPIVSDVGDLRDFAIEGNTGYVLQEEDIEGFAKRIIDVLQDDSLRDRLSNASRKLILAKADRAIVAQRWHNILNQLTLD